jgi:hypothetical protein
VFAASIIRAMMAPMMEAAKNSEMSVNFYQTAWRNIPKDSHLHSLNLLTVSMMKLLHILSVEKMYKKVVMGYFKTLSQHLPNEDNENYEKKKFRSRFYVRTPQIQRSFNHYRIKH